MTITFLSMLYSLPLEPYPYVYSLFLHEQTVFSRFHYYVQYNRVEGCILKVVFSH